MKHLSQRAPAAVTIQHVFLLLVGKPAVLFGSLEKTNCFEIGGRFLQQTAAAEDMIRGDPEIAFETGCYVSGRLGNEAHSFIAISSAA